MAHKPNYKFERLERQKAKAAKKAARLDAKKEKSDERKAENTSAGLGDDELAAPAEDSMGAPAGVPTAEPTAEPAGEPREDGD